MINSIQRHGKREQQNKMGTLEGRSTPEHINEEKFLIKITILEARKKKNNLVGREFRILSASNKSQDVTSEQHLYDTNSSTKI